MHNDQEYLEFAKNVAIEAGAIILKHFQAGVTKEFKEDDEIVTIADREVNEMVIKRAEAAYPHITVLGEEASNVKASEEAWVCDPIDGTMPFSQGIPVSTFSIALVRNGVPVVAAVLDPFGNRLYTAIKGSRAYMNDTPIHVSNKMIGSNSIIDNSWWPQAEFNLGKIGYEIAVQTGAYVPCLGSVVHAACLVARGEYDACLFAGTRGKYCDVAAVKLIVEEAGGRVTDLFGNEQRYDEDIKGAIISNRISHRQILKLTKNL